MIFNPYSGTEVHCNLEEMLVQMEQEKPDVEDKLMFFCVLCSECDHFAPLLVITSSSSLAIREPKLQLLSLTWR